MKVRRAGTLVVACLTIAACSSGSGRPAGLQIDGDPGAVVNNVNHVPAGTPYVFELMAVCSGQGASAITDVELIKPDNVKLVDWGVRSHSIGEANPSRVRANGVPLDLSALQGFNHNQISDSCADPNTPTELGVTLIKSQARTAQVHGFYIHYRAGGRSGRLLEDFTIMMCPGDCPGFVR